MATKYYAVKKGRVPGIYTSWPEAQQQIMKYSGAQYKSFTSLEEAHQFLKDTTPKHLPTPQDYCAYVDGSYSKQKQAYSSGVIILKNKQVLQEFSWAENHPQFTESYQIAGEVFAALKAIEWTAQQNPHATLYLYYDYLGIEQWATGAWKTNKPISKAYVKKYKELIQTYPITIYFCKVKAHNGVQWNEHADQLAKQAIQ